MPLIFAMVIGVGALTTGYSMRSMREANRARFQKDHTEALYQAWAQMELVTYMVNTSGYDSQGNNAALMAAAGRADRMFIDPDGWPTGVTAQSSGGTGSGFYELVSEATINGVTRGVTALMRERQSFADFNVFVASHSVGISGGQDANFPFSDAPEGSIHSNDMVQFYFPDRHFRDPVTSVNGFDYVAGARGPNHLQGSNTYFHGPVNDAVDPITGLTDVITADFATGGTEAADTILSLDGQWDYAYVKFKGDTVEVRHYVRGHNEQQTVTFQQDYGHWEPYDAQVRNYVAQQQTVTVPVDHYDPVTVTYQVTVQVPVFVEGGGGGETGGSGGSGETGYYIYVDQVETRTRTDWVYSHTTYEQQTQTVWVWDGTYRTEVRYNWIVDGTNTVTQLQTIYVPTQFVATHNLSADGVVYVRGDIHIDRMRTSRGDPYDVHKLDGSVTLVSGDDIRIRDSIQYAHPDQNGNLQSAYLNGDDYSQDYIPNPNYGGASVLGLIANDEISYETNYLPQNTEINATMLAKGRNVFAKGIRVASSGSVSESGTAYVRDSLRRLGGLISNRRPVSSYVDGNNAVTRGFIRGKTVFDRRQLVNPPRGFPTLNRPRVLATVVKEVR
jgi:hypothetical protein